MNRHLLEQLFEWSAIRWLAAAGYLARGAFWWALGRRYRAFSDLCWVARASRTPFLQARAERVVLRVIEHIRRTGHNPIADWYRADRASAACANIYKQGGRGSADLLRDLIVLRAATKDEKGVVLLKYVRTFHAIVALLDVDAHDDFADTQRELPIHLIVGRDADSVGSPFR